MSLCVHGECEGSDEVGCVDICSMDRCLGRQAACVDHGGTGTKGCDYFTTCFDMCMPYEKAGYSCMAKCFNQLSSHAKQLAKQLTDCVDENGIISKCCINTVRCFTDGQTGDKPCGYYLNNCVECVDENPGDDEYCFFSCMEQLSDPPNRSSLNRTPWVATTCMSTATAAQARCPSPHVWTSTTSVCCMRSTAP